MKILKDFHDKSALFSVRTALETLHPELKESEDEKVRKEIIDYITLYKDSLDEEEYNSWLARLEKQGKGKLTNKPKFKVGDWIVQNNIGIYKIVEVCESWYEVIDNQNNHYSIGFDKEYMCHLWTIEDAKDGDVLAEFLKKEGYFSVEFDPSEIDTDKLSKA